MSTENVLNEEKGNGVLADVSGSLPSENEINNKALEFANKRYYSESNQHDTTMNDFKAGAKWLLGYMAGNDR